MLTANTCGIKQKGKKGAANDSISGINMSSNQKAICAACFCVVTQPPVLGF